MAYGPDTTRQYRDLVIARWHPRHRDADVLETLKWLKRRRGETRV